MTRNPHMLHHSMILKKQSSRLSASRPKCSIPLMFSSEGGQASFIQIRLMEKSTQSKKPMATWSFQTHGGMIEALKLDLWRIDNRTIWIETSDGPEMCREFTNGQPGDLTRGLYLEVWLAALYQSPHRIMDIDLDLSGSGLIALKERLRIHHAPPIQWFFLEITNHCNYKCAWCPQRIMKRSLGRMTLEKARLALNQIRAYQQKYPSHTFYSEIKNHVFLHVMGEPLLHPDIFEIIRYGSSLGLNLALVTNASLLTKENTLKLLDSGIGTVVLSLNAPDAKTFKSADTNISYEKVVSNIKRFLKARYQCKPPWPRTEIQLLNTKYVSAPCVELVEQPLQVERLYAEWSIIVRKLERRANVVRHSNDASSDLRRQLVLDTRGRTQDTYFQLGHDVWIVFKQACNFANIIRPPSVDILTSSRGKCPFENAHRVFCILWDGSSTYCSLDYDGEVKLGNIFENGIETIWSGDHMHRIRRLMEHGVLGEALCRRCLGALQ